MVSRKAIYIYIYIYIYKLTENAVVNDSTEKIGRNQLQQYLRKNDLSG